MARRSKKRVSKWKPLRMSPLIQRDPSAERVRAGSVRDIVTETEPNETVRVLENRVALAIRAPRKTSSGDYVSGAHYHGSAVALTYAHRSLSGGVLAAPVTFNEVDGGVSIGALNIGGGYAFGVVNISTPCRSGSAAFLASVNLESYNSVSMAPFVFDGIVDGKTLSLGLSTYRGGRDSRGRSSNQELDTRVGLLNVMDNNERTRDTNTLAVGLLNLVIEPSEDVIWDKRMHLTPFVYFSLAEPSGNSFFDAASYAFNKSWTVGSLARKCYDIVQSVRKK